MISLGGRDDGWRSATSSRIHAKDKNILRANMLQHFDIAVQRADGQVRP